jgi:hypothetical protein
VPEELLDAAVYCRQLLYEREHVAVPPAPAPLNPERCPPDIHHANHRARPELASDGPGAPLAGGSTR